MKWQVMRGVGLGVLAVAIGTGSGCRHEHDHDGDHDHDEDYDHDEGGEHAREGEYHHAQEHPAGHDHHAPGHGHHEAMESITHYSPELELFAEHPRAVAGKPLDVLAHLTVLDGFQALREGQVTLELRGPATTSAESDAPLRPGIYRLSLTAPAPGTYTGRLRVRSEALNAEMDGLEITVHDSAAKPAEPAHSDEEPYISFLKEQQWKVAFGTAFAGEGKVVPSVQVPGEVAAPPGGLAEVSAPVAGTLSPPPGGWPRPGDQVKSGALLARLSPAPSSAADVARARLSEVEARARLRTAEADLGRAERLIVDQAISQRALEQARREVTVAAESLAAAEEVSQLFAGARSGRGAGQWRLIAPIAGTLIAAKVSPGGAVEPHDVLFRIVSRDELWLQAHVPEQDAARLRPTLGGSYRVAGLDTWQPLAIGGPDAHASLVTLSPVVDPRTRAVEVVFALTDPEPTLRVGGLVTLELPVGEAWQGLVVPRAAVIEEGGRTLIYVQVDGEHFEERPVTTGVASGNLVAITDGLSVGERIVVRGANLLRLAARSAGGAPAHGHIH